MVTVDQFRGTGSSCIKPTNGYGICFSAFAFSGFGLADIISFFFIINSG